MATYSKTRLGNINTETYAIYQALKNPQTPIGAKLAGLTALIYLFLPFDIITDLLPIIGWADDFVICFVLTKIAASLVPAEIMAESRLIAEKRGKNIMRIIFIAFGLMAIISLLLMAVVIKAIAGLF